jgi:hypothetical protein
MKLIETTVLETTIRMRYADDADPAKATQWIDFQVNLADLVLPDAPDQKLGDLESHYLAVIRQAALRYARDTIGAETQRLARLASQKF